MRLAAAGSAKLDSGRAAPHFPRMAAPRFATYAEFWPYYLREHADPRTRAVHAAGTVLGLGLLAAGLVLGPLWLVPAGVVVGYAAAWLSHLLIERNRPATFTYPLWSLASDLRLCALLLTGRLPAAMRRAEAEFPEN
jgi:hypothetical protein